MGERVLASPPYRPGPLSTHPPARQCPSGLRWHSAAAPDRTGPTGQTTAPGAHTSSRIHSARL